MGEIKRKKLSRAKQKQEAPLKLKEDQNRWQQKHRLVDSQKKRLYRFKRNTMFNAIFTCMCCQRNLFKFNVTKFTSNLLERKKEAWPVCKGHRRVQLQSNYGEYKWQHGVLHLPCLQKAYMQAGKIPPMSARNELKIHDHDLE